MVEPQRPIEIPSRKEDQIGHKSSSKIHKDMVPQKIILGKVRT
jgi:hypothetical protein